MTNEAKSPEYLRLLGIGYEVMKQVGHKRLSLEKVALEAGVSNAEVQKHFSSTEELLEGILDYSTETLMEQVDTMFEGKSNGGRPNANNPLRRPGSSRRNDIFFEI